MLSAVCSACAMLRLRLGEPVVRIPTLTGLPTESRQKFLRGAVVIIFKVMMNEHAKWLRREESEVSRHTEVRTRMLRRFETMM